MKKIEALAAIIEDNSKIAYNTEIKHAMCAVDEFVKHYKVQNAILTKKQTNDEVNCNLLEEGWEVSNEYTGKLKDFKFQPLYREITRDEAYDMLDRGDEKNMVQVTDYRDANWENGTLVGVVSGNYPFFVTHHARGRSICFRYCRVKI